MAIINRHSLVARPGEIIAHHSFHVSNRDGRINFFGRSNMSSLREVLGFRGVIEIEIAIGIAIDSYITIGSTLFLNLVSWPAQATKHCRHAIQFDLTFPTFVEVQRFANDQHVLNRRALQSRSSRDLEVSPPVSLARLSVSLSDIKRDRLAGSKPLIPCRSMRSSQRFRFLKHPFELHLILCFILYRHRSLHCVHIIAVPQINRLLLVFFVRKNLVPVYMAWQKFNHIGLSVETE